MFVNLTNPKATPTHQIVGKTKTHYSIKKPDGQVQQFPKERIARVNKQAWDIAKKDPEKYKKRVAATEEVALTQEELDRIDEIAQGLDELAVRDANGKLVSVKKVPVRKADGKVEADDPGKSGSSGS